MISSKKKNKIIRKAGESPKIIKAKILKFRVMPQEQ
jgi:hypothetical protein